MTLSTVEVTMQNELTDTNPATQALRSQFEALLNGSKTADPVSGELALGEILSVEKDGLRVDIGGKSEGFCPVREIPGIHSFDELQQTYRVGQATEFFVVSEQDSDEHPYYRLSVRRVNAFKNWDHIIQLMNDGSIIEVTVAAATKGGVLVNVLDLKGFIPASQLRVAKTLPELVGTTLIAKILEVDKDKNKLILSNRQAIFETQSNQRVETMNKLEVGHIVEGAVVKMTHFGAFIDINGIDGLLPLSEISWRRVQHPSEAFVLGEVVRVVVLSVDQERQRISLSKKRLEQDPWETAVETLTVGDVIEAPVTKLLGSGVLAEIMPGVEAYCHNNSRPGQPFEVGETTQFRVVAIHTEDRRITLKWASSESVSEESTMAETNE
ncbi:MAG: S1 RNA-binding domain-containing protein [Vampirovibrionales bacterium]